jgi:hypothetical protein
MKELPNIFEITGVRHVPLPNEIGIEVGPVLDELHGTWLRGVAKCKPSDNCGVHIHINVQEMTLPELMNFMMLYLVFEDLMVKWCGDDREGNFFCLRSKDAEGLVEALIDLKQHWNLQDIISDDLRYASMNIVALIKFGSLEFRAMRTPKDIREIAVWVDLLTTLKDQSKNFRYPHEILEGFSADGVTEFVNSIFGDRANLLDFPDVLPHLMDGIRVIQDISYAPQKDAPKTRKDLGLGGGRMEEKYRGIDEPLWALEPLAIDEDEPEDDDDPIEEPLDPE